MRTPDYTELDRLFARWQRRYPFTAFIRNGIVDPARYDSPHILFILRDKNQDTPGDLCYDLREYGSGWKTWNNVGRWAKALLDGKAEYPRDMSRAKRIEQLTRIAVLNLKKEGGGPRTIGAELEQAVKEQQQEIREEIGLLSPDLILCCGLPAAGMPANAELLQRYIFPDEMPKIGQITSHIPGRAWPYYLLTLSDRSIPVVSFCHPQVTVLSRRRGHQELFIPLYEDMLDIGRKFLSHS